MSRVRSRPVIVVLALLAAACAARAEDRPKIGVVLSGGGARGIAHIGVLKVLEELRVPIDCIAGTSMGSIIGGLYAAGLSPGEIEEALQAIDWDDAFSDQPPRDELTFRRKDDDRRYPYDLELGWRDGKFRAPSGLLTGQKLNFILQSLVVHLPAEMDFDDLRIPFRAVATDIETGEPVVLDRGNLAEAMRASMAIYGAFSPVLMDGRLLMDGGVVDNLPVDVARAMGADVVIAVDVRGALLPRDKLGSLVKITLQAIDIANRQTDEQSAADADIVIRPDLADLTAGSFSQVGPLTACGEAAARDLAPALGEHALAEKEYARHRAGRRAPRLDRSRVDFVAIEGADEVSRRRIGTRIYTRPGDRFDLVRIREDINRVFGMGEFESVTFKPVVEEGREGIAYKVREKPWGPNYFHAAFEFDDDFSGNNAWNILLNYTRTRLNALGGEWRNDVQFGETRRVFSEVYQPLDWYGRFFVSPSAQYLETLEYLYEDQHRLAEYEVSLFEAGLDLGIEFRKYGEFRIGGRWGRGRGELATGPEDLPDESGTVGGILSRLVVDRLDSATFPRQGGRTELHLFLSRDALGADDTYDQLYADSAQFFSRGPHTVFIRLQGGTSFDDTPPLYDEFDLGGLFSLSGYGRDELRGPHYGLGLLGYYFRLMKLPSFVGRGLYAGGWLSAGNVWTDRDEASLDDLLWGGTLAIGADTKLGPVYLAYGYGDEGVRRAYFSVGVIY